MLRMPPEEKWILLDEVDSTNRYLMEGRDGGHEASTVCIAKRQTDGRGRRGRDWQSIARDSLIFSARFEGVGLPPDQLGRLPLFVGVCMAKAVEAFRREESGARPGDIQLKWPNDLYLVEDERLPRKLAGILVESTATEKNVRVVVGIGMNWTAVPEGDFPVAGVSLLENTRSSPLDFVRKLAVIWNDSCEELSQDGPSFLKEYDRRSYLKGKAVRLGQVTGRVVGVASDGALLLESELGKRIAQHSANEDIEVLAPGLRES